MTGIKVEGMEVLLANLQKLGEKMAGRVQNRALRAGAEVLRDEIAKRAPRRTGKLADSITMSNVKTKEGVKYIEVGPDKDHFYGLFLEFGTTKMAAQPFVAPAIIEKRSEVMEVIRSEVKAGLDL